MFIINRKFLTVNLVLLFCLIYCSQCETKVYCSRGFCKSSKQHRMCKFQSTGPASSCINYEKLINTEKEKQNVLDRINSRRNKVSSGEIRSFPSAANMLKLEWSEELEVLAQRLADQCFNSSTDETEWCHSLESSSVGQNIGTVYGDAPGVTAASLVDLWYMELLNMNASYLLRYTPSSTTASQHYDYFTQLIWAETSRVGCGSVKYTEINRKLHEHRNRTVYRIICNFAPSGNILGQAVYNEGKSCSRCPYNSPCDTKYQYLCSSFSRIDKTELSTELHLSKEYKPIFIDNVSLNDLIYTTEYRKIDVTEPTKINKEQNIITLDMINDNDTNFDFLSHLFDITSAHPSNLKQSTISCKDTMAIEEFIELLKIKLNSEQSLKDLLMSSTKALTPDPSLTDRTVAAIVNQLYSKKETTTMSKSTYDQNINSTLLADLVEAVIFRQSDRFWTTEDISLLSQNPPNVSPVKIQAELGETQANAEFTGHYFFPEEEDKMEPETTEIYDELENSGISEISFEIDELKKNRETKDFLEEILESDFTTESVTMAQLVLNNSNVSVTYVTTMKTNLENFDLRKNAYQNNRKTIRIKRRLQTEEDDSPGIFIKYSDLLKKLAADLRNLQLNEKFHCSSKYAINSTGTFYFFYYYLIIHSYYTLYFLF